MQKKAVLASVLIALVCVTVLVAASVALFSQSATVDTYLNAGELKISLVRTDLKGRFADKNGVLSAEKTFTEDVDLTDAEATGNSAFKFGNEQSPVFNVPGVWEEAWLKLTNLGNVAFDYSLTFIYGEESAPVSGTPEYNLANKLLVTVSLPDGTPIKSGTLAQTVQDGKLELGTITATNAHATIRVKVELPYEADSVDDGTGDTVMNANLKFGFVITATQHVAGAIN